MLILLYFSVDLVYDIHMGKCTICKENTTNYDDDNHICEKCIETVVMDGKYEENEKNEAEAEADSEEEAEADSEEETRSRFNDFIFNRFNGFILYGRICMALAVIGFIVGAFFLGMGYTARAQAENLDAAASLIYIGISCFAGAISVAINGWLFIEVGNHKISIEEFRIRIKDLENKTKRRG